jgi:hypothetical protein
MMPGTSVLWPQNGVSVATESSQDGYPSMYQVLTLRCPGAALSKMASSPSGLQVPVLFKTFGCTRIAPHGGQSGPCLCSVACPRRGHLALRLASTVHGFGASTLPIPTAKVSWEQPSMAGVLSCHAPLHACGQVGEVRRVPMHHSEGRLALVCVLTLLKIQGIHSHLHYHFAILLLVIAQNSSVLYIHINDI